MALLTGSKRALLFDTGGYLARMQALFGSSIIGYWPMDEPSGSVAIDYSGNGFHGAYTGVTLGQPGIGDGRTCPFYDGANDYMQPPAGFRTAFTPAEFTFAGFFRVTGASVWTDTATRRNIIGVDASNRTIIEKNAANNTIVYTYAAGGTAKTVSRGSTSPTAWFHMGLTVSVSGDAMKAYYNGAQTGATQTSLGTWVGTPAAVTTTIGAGASTPINVWDGYIAHVFVLNRAATAAEMLAAATV